ncbi:MAG: ATP-dependent DNA helicase RecG, partial [Anaerolineales bacterium]|nr:ATP-dependent DNA helicase RecG [Anaerolineales bacterium]
PPPAAVQESDPIQEVVPPPPAPESTPQRYDPDPDGLAQPVSVLYGVGPRIASLLEKLGVYTILDLLYLFPRRYDDYSLMKPINRLKYGEMVTIIGTVWDVRARRNRNNQTHIHAVVTDGTGKIQVTWFNQPWLVNKLKAGLRVVLQGTVDQYLGRPVFQNPDWEMLSLDSLRTGTIVPIYPLTQGLGSHRMRQMQKGVVEKWAAKVPDPIPPEIIQRNNLFPLPKALEQIHLPESQEALFEARRRLIFDELFLLQLGMLGQRRDWLETPGRALINNGRLLAQFQENLPFQMTAAQQRVIQEITADMGQPKPMSRLLQGDVGAGKTVVAAIAMLTAVESGAQAALMAPTEILAEQHYQGLSKLLQPLGVEVVLLTGGQGAADKREALEQISNGSAHIAIGTHALIQDGVDFANLGLAVIDEQHRFGVDQRAILKEKGPIFDDQMITPHVLVMSATPIPRSLALSLYGDLDLSILDEIPPGRQEIMTRWLRPRERERAYSFVRGQVSEGRQVYIICPLVEESDKIEATAAVEEYERLQNEIFPDLRLGLVHGRLKSDEKEAVMRQFYAGELDILVSTSVIEVGVDVPNSTVMLIEGANRFGLAQLHQFRGRVGRGEHKSYCILIADETTPEAEERLTALEQTNDGFQLAEKDLELRGPGEFFGRRQSGLPELTLSSLTDMDMLQLARREADQILGQDPHLQQEKHLILQERIIHFWENAADVS